MLPKVSSPSLPTSGLLKNWTWSGRNILAVAAATVMCWALLDAVLYCDTSYRATFGTGRCTLAGLFISTFLGDLRDQFNGLFHSTPAGSIAGEVTATEWTQCLFVPFIVGWLVYWLWPRLRELPLRGHPHGYTLLGAGLLLYLGGYMAENYYFGIVSLQLVYAGLIVLFLGWKAMRMLLFPWAFLLFMWPYGFFEDVAFQLRMIMSSLSHHALLLIGVPNALNGTAIVSAPGDPSPFAIDIADPCSGIRSLFALVMIAALAAFVLYRDTWQKALIVLAAVPMVIFGNLVRIVMLTLATIHFGEAFALGINDHPSWFHEGAGYLVYLINFAGLLGFGWLLTRLSSGPERTRQP
jgi:exosortase